MTSKVETHNRKVLKSLKVGDLVEFPRELISHWGVYIGDGEIIHLTATDCCRIAADSSTSHVLTNGGIEHEKGCVKKEKFWDVVENSKVERNNDKDTDNPPFSRSEIKERALSKLGPIPYNFWCRNCEHFASWCRNGIPKSEQVDTVLGGSVIVGALISGLGIIGAVLWLFISGSSKNR